MSKNLIVRYSKDNEKGNYSFESVKLEDEKISVIGNVISVDLNVLNSIRNKTEDKLVSYSFKKDQPIVFKLDSTIYDSLLMECQKKSKNQEECDNIIQDGIKEIFNGIKNIEPSENNGIISYRINYNTVSKNKDDSKDGAESEIITEINMANFQPDEIIRKIKKKVVAQDNTVETIVNNIYNNQIILESQDPDVIGTSKVNIFMDGPTGTGKTLIVKSTANEMSLPINIIPATIFSAPGYKGTALEEMLKPLLDKTGGNLELAERGIVVLDEFDKLGYKGDNALEMNKAVQHNLLTFLSGTKIPLEYNGNKIEFDTSKITFICLGAFTDLRERKIKEGLNEDGKYTIKPEDYINEGMLREVVGRFSLITATQSLGRDALRQILVSSSISPLKSLQKVGKIYGKEIKYDDELVDRIVELALEEDTGARALQTVVNGISNQILRDLRDKSITTINLTTELLDKSQEIYSRSVAA